MSDGARCHYCQKSPCICWREEHGLPYTAKKEEGQGIFRDENFGEKGRLIAYQQGPQPPDWLSLRLCPPHASIHGTLRPIESCPICLRNHRDELINVLVGISGVTGWNWDKSDSFSDQGVVDLNRNLEIAKQLIGDVEIADSRMRSLRSAVTLAAYNLERAYGTAFATLHAMRAEIDRRLRDES